MSKCQFIEDLSPLNFDDYMPWACCQLCIESTIVINSVKQNEYYDGLASAKKDRKIKTQSKVNADMLSSKTRYSDTEIYKMASYKEDTVIITTVYDNHENLVQLKFHKNTNVPRNVLKVIALLVPFHPNLTSIYIDSGLNKGGMHELGKILALSKVTEVILNNLVLPEGNYYLLLDNNAPLKYLSLARCQLNDVVIEALASRLTPPLSASKTLSILNLSSNRITDLGVKYLSEALRTNRQLSYLNLAGNMITDEGADSIFNILSEFPLTPDEIKEQKLKRMTYYKKANEMVMEIDNNTQSDDNEKRNISKKPTKVVVSKKSKLTRKDSARSSAVKVDSLSSDRAKIIAKAQLEPYDDPFSSENVIIKEGIIYCLGNNTLCCINLAYNNLSYFSVKKLYKVLTRQRGLNRTPQGLIKVGIEGNNLPESCMEYSAIDYMMSGLSSPSKILVSRKRTVIKGLK